MHPEGCTINERYVEFKAKVFNGMLVWKIMNMSRGDLKVPPFH